MTEYQVTRWREMPSMVAARAGDENVKSQLAMRFEEAVELEAEWPAERIAYHLDGLGG